jgi:hypothetical protein
LDRVLNINLLSWLEAYLIFTFILTILRRYQQYRAMMGVIVAAPNRWPRLLELLHANRTVFLTWPTLLPVVLTFVLMGTNSIALNFVWITAKVTPLVLWEHWPALVLAVGFGSAMLYLDVTTLAARFEFDRPLLEKHLDQAEYWLGSWVAPAVKVLTFGYVNPKKMVHEEVMKSLHQVTQDLNRMMWRWALQIAMRLAFGLTLWLTWAGTMNE